MHDDQKDEGKIPEDPLIEDQAIEDEEPMMDSPDHVDQERLRRLFSEKLVPEILRRGIESGMDTFLRSDRGVRKAISDLKMRRELTNYFFHQIDETKNAALRVIAREVREFLENTNLEQSLYTVLTSLAFEIKTEVRFIPTENGQLKPKVASRVEPSKRKRKPTRKAARKTAGKKKPSRPRSKPS